MKHVIIGNGIAGLSTAETIRRNRGKDEIILLSNEARPPYWRASLSKYILGVIPAHKMHIKPDQWFQQHAIQQLPGSAIHIQSAEKKIIYHHHGNEESLPYDRLCVAVGAEPVRLPTPGHELTGVLTFRSYQDADKIKYRLNQITQMVVIGGGVLGLEVAEIAVSKRIQCTVLQLGDKIGTPLVDDVGAEILLRRVTGQDGIHPQGAEVIFNDSVDEYIGENGRLVSVGLKSGVKIPCQMVVMCVGIGTRPELFEHSGLNFDRGLLVNDHQETSIPGVYGCGDCVIYPNESGRMVPTRTWVTSRIQGKTAGFNMCDIPRLLFDEGPMYNASYLFDMVYTIVGEFDAKGANYRSVSAQPDPFSYRKIVFNHDRIVGAMMLGDRNGDQAIRRLIAQKVEIPADTDKKALLDPAFDPNDLALHGVEYVMY